MALTVCPLAICHAKNFVTEHHRHHPAPQGGLWAAGATHAGALVAAAIVGRPVARGLQDGWTAEVIRVAAIEGQKNACSLLYAACTRAARALGYRRLVTYLLASESGSSLKALKDLGWREVAEVDGRSWDCASRPRTDKHPTEDKRRWEVALAAGTEAYPALPEEDEEDPQLSLFGGDL